jgi:hypothetical protein
VFENRSLRRIFRPKRAKQGTGEESTIRSFTEYSSPDIIRMIKLRA